MIDSDEYLVGYNEPNRFRNEPFPWGFREVVEIPHRESWLPAQWYGPHRAWLCKR